MDSSILWTSSVQDSEQTSDIPFIFDGFIVNILKGKLLTQVFQI